MKHTLNLFGKSVELDEKQMEELQKLLGIEPVRLSEVADGEAFTVAGREFIALENRGGETVALLKGFCKTSTEFGKNNCYEGSYVDDVCNDFLTEISESIGSENIHEFELDLTSDDGLKDYGVIKRRAALLTTEMYRRYVDILDKHMPEDWWWLATPHSTAKHGNDSWIKCVSPSGLIYGRNCCNRGCGVRPFCIFDSSIFVSI